ncbi:MAG TPA: ABC transporter permease subunit [Clostridia bacterium]|nr:ABC transporter permease subunit [Clostridia bacterium]
MIRGVTVNKMSFGRRVRRDFQKNWVLYLLVLPVVAYYIIFHYVPMYGIQIAFRKFSFPKGYLRSPWVGLKHFRDFFESFYFGRVLRNTVMISLLDLIFGFPAPIVFALLLNEVTKQGFKRTVQTLSYLPHFISLVVLCGMIVNFSASDGLFNDIIALFGGERLPLLQISGNFRTLYTASGIWQGLGWGSIVYIAAISGVDQEQYEAAIIDGAGRFQRMWHITLPGIQPTIIILLILKIGSLMGVGSEKVILLYTPATYETADVISSFVYRMGLQRQDWGYGAAVGLFDSVINMALLVIANSVSNRITETGLW